jgi:membrane-associated phospholipid phosphatase
MRHRFTLVMVLVLGWVQWCRGEDVARPEAQDPVESPAVADTSVAGDPAVAHIPKPSGKEEFWKGWKQLPKDLVRDQKQMWLFPVSVARGKHLKPTFAVIGITAGLIALDPFPSKYFATTRSFDRFNKVFSGPNTARATYLVPLAFYGIGLVKRDFYAQKTFLVAGEAVITSEVLTSVMKDIDRRLNPNDVPIGGSFSDTWFKNKFEQRLIGGNGSFPSGHTIAAYSVATVYAKRYPNHRWIPWVAYGLAGLNGFSRITLGAHFTSDVFMGGALGYFIARQSVRDAH